MLKILLKRQMTELLSFFSGNTKKGKRRSKKAAVGILLLTLGVFAGLGCLFWVTADELCKPLVASGLTWVYFALVGTMATGLGVIGCVFAVKPRLYQAKDNDMLFAMPVAPWKILLSRTFGLYALAFVFENVVFVPAAALYLSVDFSLLSLVFLLFSVFLLPLGALTLGGLLGWLDAFLTVRLRLKNLCTVLLSVAFMAVYFLFSEKMGDFIAYAVEHGDRLGAKIKTVLFPFRQLGLAAEGKALPFIWFTLLFAGAFAVFYFLNGVTFLWLATTNKGERKAKYKEKDRKAASPFSALLKKEFLRFVKCPAYLLNSCAGTIFMLIVGSIAAVDGTLFGLSAETFATVSEKTMKGVWLAVIGVMCLFAAMNFISAPSVSLEGDAVWILQSLPAASGKIFAAKIVLHFMMTALPALFCTAVSCAVFEMNAVFVTFSVIAVTVFSFFTAVLGLVLNLLFPKMNWTNEAAAVKQSFASFLAMLINVGAVVLSFGLWFLFGKYLPSEGFFAVCVLLLLAATAVLLGWLKGKGTKRFESL